MVMAIPFHVGGYFAIDMCFGSLVQFVWQKINRAKADGNTIQIRSSIWFELTGLRQMAIPFRFAVASGLIYGDGIWTLPSSILSLAGVQTPPICMK
ncbi:Metal-nicotianamine transporter like, partial [Thalictrum thalictroides]